MMNSFYSKWALYVALMLSVVFVSCTKKTESGYIPSSGGAFLYYEMKGSGPETLIFLHGHSLDTRMWDAQFDVFAKHYRVVRFDFRGYGKSSPQREDFQFTHMGDVLTLMDSLRIEKAHIVGLSMGSFVAGDMLALAPHRMLSCVMASGGIHPRKGPSEPMTMEESAQRDEEIAALKEKGVERMKEEWLENLVSGGGSRRESIRSDLKAMIDDWSAWQALHKEVRLIYGRDAWRAIEKIAPVDVPTLVIRGSKDVKDPARFKAREMQYLSHGYTLILDDCGHMLNMEQPEAFNAVVLEFLENRNLD
ncbi:MAG: alpha/beta hydrolase [Bacteroidales bacterium]|nr:alpha/beta hydrolase [Bacteroidales bacterium]